MHASPGLQACETKQTFLSTNSPLCGLLSWEKPDPTFGNHVAAMDFSPGLSFLSGRHMVIY